MLETASKVRQPTELTEAVGALIRAQRQVKGWTQNDLADHTGRSLQLIGRIERGAAAPSFETLDALARALDVSVGDFFQVGRFRAGNSDRALARIVIQLSQLSNQDLEWAEKLLKVALERRGRAD